MDVEVNRNFKNPAWEQSKYSANIDEGMTLGSSIIQVKAKDADKKVTILIYI